MASGLEIRICTLKEIVAGGGSQSLLQAGGHSASTDNIAAKIVALEFDGGFIKSDLSDLRKTVVQALGQGFPGGAVLVIGAGRASKGIDLATAAQRALAVKDLLLALGVPARNVAADMPSAYLRPTRLR